MNPPSQSPWKPSVRMSRLWADDGLPPPPLTADDPVAPIPEEDLPPLPGADDDAGDRGAAKGDPALGAKGAGVKSSESFGGWLRRWATRDGGGKAGDTPSWRPWWAIAAFLGAWGAWLGGAVALVALSPWSPVSDELLRRFGSHNTVKALPALWWIAAVGVVVPLLLHHAGAWGRSVWTTLSATKAMAWLRRFRLRPTPEPGAGTTALILAVILLAGVVIRTHRINNPPLDFHQFRQSDTAAWARNFHREKTPIWEPRLDWGADKGRKVEAEFPIYPYITAKLYDLNAQLKGGGDGADIWIARAVNIFFFVLCGLYLFGIGADLFGRRAGLFAAALLALSPASVYFFRNIQPEGLMMASTAGCLFFARRWLDREGASSGVYWLLALVHGAVAVLGKATSVFIGVPLALMVLQYGGIRQVFRPATMLLAVGILAPGVAWYVHAHGFILKMEECAGGHNIWENLGVRFDEAFFMNETTGIARRLVYFIAGLPAAPFVVLGFVTAALTASRSLFIQGWVAVLGAYVVMSATGQIPHIYYQLPFVAPFALLVGQAMAQVWRFSVGAVLLLVLVWPLQAAETYRQLFHFPQEKGDLYSLHDDIRQFGEGINACSQPGELVISTFQDPAAMYHADRHGWVIAWDWFTDVQSCDDSPGQLEAARQLRLKAIAGETEARHGCRIQIYKEHGAAKLAMSRKDLAELAKSYPSAAQWIANSFSTPCLFANGAVFDLKEHVPGRRRPDRLFVPPTAVLAPGGRMVDDSTTRSGKAVEATATDPAGIYLAIGPYLLFPPGHYVARYHLRAEGDQPTRPVAHVDVNSNPKQWRDPFSPERTLGRREVPVAEARGKWVEIPLEFDINRLEQLEFRVQFKGGALLRFAGVEVVRTGDSRTPAVVPGPVAVPELAPRPEGGGSGEGGAVPGGGDGMPPSTGGTPGSDSQPPSTAIPGAPPGGDAEEKSSVERTTLELKPLPPSRFKPLPVEAATGESLPKAPPSAPPAVPPTGKPHDDGIAPPKAPAPGEAPAPKLVIPPSGGAPGPAPKPSPHGVPHGANGAGAAGGTNGAGGAPTPPTIIKGPDGTPIRPPRIPQRPPPAEGEKPNSPAGDAPPADAPRPSDDDLGE